LTLDRGRWCLDERRMAPQALVSAFYDANANVVQRAIAETASLSPIAPCRDADFLRHFVTPPVAAQAQIERSFGELSRAKVSAHLGKYGEALDQVAQLGPHAEILGWRPLTLKTQLVEVEVLNLT
jgi:hypothetical protein